ncbi:thiamine phosphate synthase [Lentibacillus salinarum]|uniref:Thiamine phosphate synthase n=1 Tax=Lentibacillus salinarum TaxID=446820 RepID=A0ABW3ZVG9_9BACI
MRIQELHVISTGKQSPEELISIVKQIHPYIDYIHLREKTWTVSQLEETIDSFIAAEVPQGKIVVNTNAETAYKKAVAGVQLTHRSIGVAKARHLYSGLRIGCSVHSIDEATAAEADGADYLFYGHIFESGSKPGVESRGLVGLREVVQSTSIPVMAIGGITPENARDVMASGAAGVAVLSGILLADDPLVAVRRYDIR